MPEDLLRALALMLVMEGMLPFLSPAQLRASLLRFAAMQDSTLRRLGFAAMIGGVLLLKFTS